MDESANVETVSTPKKRRAEVSARNQTKFLAKLAMCGRVTVAAAWASVDRSALYRERRANPEFAQAWDAAIEEADGVIEDEAIRRAVEGIDKPVTVAGQREVVKVYSDTLLMFILKGHNPKWRDNYRADPEGDTPDFDGMDADTQ